MNINPHLVNYEKYFLFLEFVFSDILKVAFFTVNRKSVILAKDLYPAAGALYPIVLLLYSKTACRTH